MPKKKLIDESIADVISGIIQEPLLYFSEADVQQLLAEQLRQIPQLKRKAKTGVPKGTSSNSMYVTSTVHREYGTGGARRIDIVVLDRKDVHKISRTNLDSGPKGYLKPRYAFELGTEKAGDVEKHVKSDLKKVEAATNCGYVIHIYRDTTKSTSAGLRDKTEAKIDSTFRKPIETAWKKRKPHTRILAVLLRTERDTQKMRGKCEIYCGERGAGWCKVNVGQRKRIQELIMDVLA